MDILISAHNPMTGPRHLGHHVSTMREWPKLQDKYECFFVVDDLIATFMYPNDKDEIFERSLFVAKEFMACGIDNERTSTFLTSMVPEAIELGLYLSTFFDLGLCQELHRRSYLGLISPNDREELGLPLLPTVGELIYPQLALPALTLGLRAKAFQGGEEISGYLSIIRALAKGFNASNALQFTPPIWERPETCFLHGTDGRHMVTENAIHLSDPGEARHDRYADAEHGVLNHMATALGASEAPADTAYGGFRDVLERETDCYRTDRTEPEQVMECLTDGAARAKFLIRQTLSEVKKSMGIPEILEY